MSTDITIQVASTYFKEMGQEFIMPEEMLYDAKRINEIERKEKEKAERD